MNKFYCINCGRLCSNNPTFCKNCFGLIESEVKNERERILKRFEKMCLKYFNRCPDYLENCTQCKFWEDFDKIKQSEGEK